MSNNHTSGAAGFGAALRRLIDQLDGALEAAYVADGLDFRPRYTPILRAILANGPLTLRGLADQLGVSHSAVSQTIAQMAARQLVTVTKGRDARERIVDLSDATLALMPRLERHWATARAATEALDTAVGGMLVDAVERANAALAERPFKHWLDDQRR